MKKVEIILKAEELKAKLDIPTLDDGNAIASKLERLNGSHRLNIGAIAGLDDYAKVRKSAMQEKTVQNIYTGGSGFGTFVPYTGAVANVDLGTYSIIASNLSGTNTGDQDISGIATNATNISSNTTAISARVKKVGDIMSGDLIGTDFVKTRSGSITRVGNFISKVVLTGGRTLTITRDTSNLISTIADGVRTWSFTRTGGVITDWSVV